MVTRSDYPSEIVDAALGVLVELMSLLGEYRKNIVLAGGWVPYFLFDQNEDPHCGSVDIDLALNFERITEQAYATFLERLHKSSYVEDEKSSAKFWRNVTLADGRDVLIRIDFISGEYGGTGESHRHQRVQDVLAQKARGCDLAFEEYVSVQVEARMPNGSINSVSVKIAGVVPFLVMKGMALADRFKEKDAYDIGCVLRNYPGGPVDLAAAFAPYQKNGLVAEALGKIRDKFRDVDYWGPNAYANFEQMDVEDRELAKRDVFERADAFLTALGF